MKLLLTLVLATIVACGSEQNSSENAPQKAKAPTTDSAERPAGEIQEPEMIMARVAVDAEGNEIKDSIETVVVGKDFESFASADQAEEAFANGEKLGLSDELDADSSSDSWHRNWWGQGFRWYGYWNTFNQGGGFGGGFGGGWWGNRSPNLWWGNGYRNYHYRHNYWGRGYRYHCWSRYRGW